MRFRSTLLVEGVWLPDGRVLKPGSVTGRTDRDIFPILCDHEQIGEFVLMRFGRRIVIHGEIDEAFAGWHLGAYACDTRTRNLLSSGVPTPGQHYRQEPSVMYVIFDRYVLTGATAFCRRVLLTDPGWGAIEPRPLRA